MLLNLTVITDGYDSEYEITVDSVINYNINECDFSKISCVETESDLEKPANAEFEKIIGKVRKQMII